MTTTLVTGANKGLGLETARQLIGAGHSVYLGSRDLQRGKRAAEAVGGRTVQLDVTDETSVAAAAQAIEADGGLDVLINNAGIAPEWEAPDSIIGAREVTAELMQRTLETNVVGAVRTLHAFLPLLKRSRHPVVVNVSSALASLNGLSRRDGSGYTYPGVAYPASKSALNMITVQFAKAFPSMRINSVEPGFTATDLNTKAGRQTVDEGAEIIVKMARIGPDGPTGGFFGSAGRLEW